MATKDIRTVLVFCLVNGTRRCQSNLHGISCYTLFSNSMFNQIDSDVCLKWPHNLSLLLQVVLNVLDGVFAAVELCLSAMFRQAQSIRRSTYHTSAQRRICPCLCKHIVKVARVSGTTACDDRNLDGILNIVDELEVETAVATILIDAV